MSERSGEELPPIVDGRTHSALGDELAQHPIDPDVDLHSPPQLTELVGHHVSILAMVSLGGIVGAVTRYLLEEHHPTAQDSFPWVTLVINVSGCLLIGVLMPLLETRFPGHRLARPFLATGVLGGYTTFSTYAVESHELIRTGHPYTFVVYLVGTVAVAVATAVMGQLASAWAIERFNGIPIESSQQTGPAR